MCSDRDRSLDARVVLIALQFEVLEGVVEDALRLTHDLQCRHIVRLTRQLLLHLLEVVHVDVRVTTRPDELAGLQTALMGHHHRQ